MRINNAALLIFSRYTIQSDTSSSAWKKSNADFWNVSTLKAFRNNKRHSEHCNQMKNRWWLSSINRQIFHHTSHIRQLFHRNALQYPPSKYKRSIFGWNGETTNSRKKTTKLCLVGMFTEIDQAITNKNQMLTHIRKIRTHIHESFHAMCRNIACRWRFICIYLLSNQIALYVSIVVVFTIFICSLVCQKIAKMAEWKQHIGN